MGRPLRLAEPGLVSHALNRGNGRRALFLKDADYLALERVLEEAHARTPLRLLAYCLMPNHWHLVLWPQDARALSRFAGWLALTHAQRWHAQYHNAGTGHPYQGRFQSFPIQDRNTVPDTFSAPAASGTSSWRSRSSSRCRTRRRRGSGSGASTTRSGRTARWATTRPSASVTSAIGACTVSLKKGIGNLRPVV